MGWFTAFEREQIEIRYDASNKSVMIEVNSGGLSPKYVTMHLVESDIDELIKVFQMIKGKLSADCLD